MRILIVASYNKGRFAPFILEQAEALKGEGCEISFFGLQGKGIRGYLKNLPLLKRRYTPSILMLSMLIMAYLAFSPICKGEFLL